MNMLICSLSVIAWGSKNAKVEIVYMFSSYEELFRNTSFDLCGLDDGYTRKDPLFGSNNSEGPLLYG